MAASTMAMSASTSSGMSKVRPGRQMSSCFANGGGLGRVTIRKVERPVFATNALFGGKKKKAAPKLETVIPDPDFRIAGATGAIAGALAVTGHPVGAAVPAVLAAFFAIQTTKVKFVFGPEALEVKIGSGSDEELEDTDNVIVGGANYWPYSSFTNWEFFWPGFPILVYFKETQTKQEGQIHFFPLLFNSKQVYDVMLERCGPTMNSGPAEDEE